VVALDLLEGGQRSFQAEPEVGKVTWVKEPFGLAETGLE